MPPKAGEKADKKMNKKKDEDNTTASESEKPENDTEGCSDDKENLSTEELDARTRKYSLFCFQISFNLFLVFFQIRFLSSRADHVSVKMFSVQQVFLFGFFNHGLMSGF